MDDCCCCPNLGLEKQNQGGKNYDLRDAIKQIEGIKLIQQEQQKKYFLTIASVYFVRPCCIWSRMML
jgi:hypothetical protein